MFGACFLHPNIAVKLDEFALYYFGNWLIPRDNFLNLSTVFGANPA